MQLPIAVRLLATLAFAAVIVALSVVPGQPKEDDAAFVWLVAGTPPPVQKLMHAVVYGVLAALWAWTFQGVAARWTRLGLALVLTVALGAALEWQQTQIPGRYGSLTDVLLNAAGAVAGLLAVMLVG